ncbi:MAG TPA: hypothetical protein VK524_33560, partial [Polyangiaceae bacterium]|nr:hypothetical protein [Polyangiaceae bacterium]
MRYAILTTLFGLAALAGCSSDGDKSPAETPALRPNIAPPGQPWKTLSEWRLFADIERQEPASTVIPFEVNSVL